MRRGPIPQGVTLICEHKDAECWTPECRATGCILDRKKDEPTGARADEPLRRFSCFEAEDGVYEHAQGSHVTYADYARIQRDLEAARVARDTLDGMLHEECVKVDSLNTELRLARSDLEAARGINAANEGLMTMAQLACKGINALADELGRSADKDGIGPASIPYIREHVASIRAQLASADEIAEQRNRDYRSLSAQLASAERDAARLDLLDADYVGAALRDDPKRRLLLQWLPGHLRGAIDDYAEANSIALSPPQSPGAES